MIRKIALLLLACTLPFAGCDKIPGLKKKAPATPPPSATPIPVAVAEPVKSEPVEAVPPAPVANPHASVMVLCLHNIEDKSGMKSLTITVAELEREMQAIKDHGFTVIGMQDFLAWRRGEKSIPAKSCVITIDDGWVSGYTNAWPVMKKFGYPFTLFVYVNYIGSGGKSLTWDQLAEMRDAGVDIQSHTYSHSNLRAPGTGVDAKTKALVQKDIQTLGKEGWLRKEIIDSKKVLEERLGIKVNALAYPFGIHTAEARALVKEAGYEAAFTVYGQRLTHSSPFDLLGRYAVEAAKPVIFESALTMVGGGVAADDSGGSATTQLAATSMITEPLNNEVITNPTPTIKANLATLGALDSGSVVMRVGGLGVLPAKYDEASKTISYTVPTPLKPGTYTVRIAAKTHGQPIDTAWSFSYSPDGVAPEQPAAHPSATEPAATTAPAKKKKK